MPKPIIGVTAFSAYHKEIKQYCGLSYDYIKAIQQAGGIPFLITPWTQDVEQLLCHVDGLLLTGGVDINPKLYDQLPHPAIKKMSDQRDQVEMECLKLAYKKTMPILGVCRGCQLMNIFLGGDLIQHLPDIPHANDHCVTPMLTRAHPVMITPGSQLENIYGKSMIEAISWHHQAIDRLGAGLVVSARAADTIVEAIEVPDYPSMMMGVQYHPESCLDQYPDHMLLFEAFVSAC